MALLAGGVLAVACGGEITQASGGEGGASDGSSSTSNAMSGSGAGSTTATTGTTGPGSSVASTGATTTTGTTVTTGGGGAGMLSPCEQACTDLFNCGLQNNNCPGFANVPPATFIQPCVVECQGVPALISLVDPNNCAGTIQTLKGVSQEFAMLCDGGP